MTGGLVYARLGQTVNEIEAQYGKPLKTSKPIEPATASGLYDNGGFAIIVGFCNGKSCYEFFQKRTKVHDLTLPAMSDGEIQQILNANGKSWTKTLSAAGDRQWVRDDNRVQAFYQENEAALKILAKEMFDASDRPPANQEATTQRPSAKIIEYGRYRVTVVSLTPVEGASGGVNVNWKNPELIETTRKIPCSVGESWGYRVRWRNLPTRRSYEFRTEITHPPINQPDGSIVEKDVFKATVKAGVVPDDLIINWHFLKGFEYELVPGKWTKKVFVDNVEVASMEFEIQQ
jgi:hypothetical protein